MTRISRARPRRATVAIAMVIAMVVVNLIIISIVIGGARDHDLTVRRLETIEAFYAVEAGMNMAIREMMNNTDGDGDGAIGTISDDGNDANDPMFGQARVLVTASITGTQTTLMSRGRTGQTRREVQTTVSEALNSPEFKVSTSTGEAKVPKVAMSADGSFVVVWEDKTNKDILGQRYDASGKPLGGEFKVSASEHKHDDKDPSIAMADDGSFVVIWENKKKKDIYVRRYDASGSALGSGFEVGSSQPKDEDKDPSIAMADDGSFIVTWENKKEKDIYARRYDASGSALGSEIKVSTSKNKHKHNDENKDPSIAMSDDGSFVVTWENKEEEDIYARRYDSFGNPLGSEFQVSSSSDEDKNPSIAMSDDNSFVVTWENKKKKGIYARRYNALGSALGSQFKVNASKHEGKDSSVAVADDGSFVVSWENKKKKDIYVRRYDPFGNPLGNEFQVSSLIDENKDSAIAMAGDGRFVVAWQDKDAQDIYARRYDAFGNPVSRRKIVLWQEVEPQ